MASKIIGSLITLFSTVSAFGQTIEDVANEINGQEIQFKTTSLAIAVQESEAGRSHIFKSKLNPFGLRAKRGGYLKFESIAEAVSRYKKTHDKIVSRFHPKTEKQFLRAAIRFGYAEDRAYFVNVYRYFKYAKKLLDND